MLKIIVLTLIVLVAALLIYATTKPNTFRVQRTANINAPPDKIFPLINDLHSFNTWNPYEKKDPNIKGNYSGPSSGKGAEYAFDGLQPVGDGTNVTWSMQGSLPYVARSFPCSSIWTA